MLPRDVVDFSFLQVFKVKQPSLVEGAPAYAGWNKMSLKVPSNTNHSIILW